MRGKCFGAGSPLSSSREGRRRLGEPLPHQLADNRLPAQSISPHSRSGRAHALELLSLIAAHNRCASGVRAALPAYPFPRLTLTSGMSQFGPASGSHMETRGRIITAAWKSGMSALVLHLDHSSKLNQRPIIGAFQIE